MKTCYGYSLEAPYQGISIEYHNICMFLWRNKNKKNEPGHDKTTISLVQLAKTQISLHICAVWSESSADRMCLLQPPDYPKRDKCEPLPYWVNVQADLSLCWSYRSYCKFCLALAKILSGYLYVSGALLMGCLLIEIYYFLADQNAELLH